MKASKGNIVNQNREKLEEIIPLKIPFSVTIDPCNLCNFKCEFCAVQFSNRKQNYKKQRMEFALYKKIIDDIKEFDRKLKVLRLSGQGEPLFNQNFSKMIEYAVESEVADWIETVTNGSKLNPKLNEELVNSGINRIRISIEALNAKGYEKIAHTKIDYEEFLNNIKDLYEKSRGKKCEIYIKTVDAAVPKEEDKKKFYELFGGMCDRIFIDEVIPLWSDFKEINQNFKINSLRGLHGQKVREVSICPFPFYSCIVNPDGQVTVCCADWQRKFVIGDVSKQSMKDIWQGEMLRKFWIDLSSKQKDKYEMCQKCLLPAFDCNDNLDEFGDKILYNLCKKKGI